MISQPTSYVPNPVVHAVAGPEVCRNAGLCFHRWNGIAWIKVSCWPTRAGVSLAGVGIAGQVLAKDPVTHRRHHVVIWCKTYGAGVFKMA